MSSGENVVSIGHSANCSSVPRQENACSHIGTLPIPKADFSGAPVAGGKPSILHTTVATVSLHPSPHKLCHCPSANTSTRPWLGDTPSDNLTGTKKYKKKIKQKAMQHYKIIFYYLQEDRVPYLKITLERSS